MSTISLNFDSLQIWQNNRLEYLRYKYDLAETDLIVDIGAFQGLWSKEMQSRYRCNAIAIEPTEYIRDLAPSDKVQVINKAAGTHNGKIQFGGMSYYTSAFEAGTHEYECFDINGLLTDLPDIAVLKVNTEGAEYSLLDHIIGAGLHLKIRNLQVQFHQIEGRPYEHWYMDISKKLEFTHELTWSYPFCWENWRLKDEK